MEAAAAAEARLGYGEAAALYTLLLPVVTTGIDRARLLCRLGKAYWLMSLPGRAVEPLQEGVRMLDQAGESLEAARHRLTLGRSHWEKGDAAAALTEYEAARETLEPVGPGRELALAYIRLSGMHTFNLELSRSRELAEKAIATAEAAGADDMRIWALNFLGLAVGYAGDYEGGIALLEQSAREASERGLDNIAGNALHNVSLLYLDNLQPEKMRELIPRLEAIKVERWGTLSSRFVKMMWAHMTGELQIALQTAKEALAHSQELDEVITTRSSRLGLGLVYTELGRLEEARAYVTPPTSDSEAQDSIADAWLWIRFHLADGDLQKALEGADFLLTLPRPAIDDAAEGAIDAYVSAGRLEAASRLLAKLQESPAPAATQAANLARARIALATGDIAAAGAGADAATRAFAAAGMTTRELPARLLLAEVQFRAGNTAAAESEFRQVLEVGRRHGYRLHQRRAEEGLARLGITVEPVAAEQVRGVQARAELGERLVTVMFVDVRGYTAMTGARPPAEMVDLVSTYQRWAAQEVERHFGVVDKFAGDAGMATFNISGDQVDHAAHALRAALALRDKAALLGLPVGVGIATGPAVVGTLKTGANLSVVGETTNLAARLQSHAGAGEVLLSEESYRRLETEVDAAPAVLELKGFAQPVAAYRIAAPTSAVQRSTAVGGSDRPSE
jgi:class 3 adenylate cyclase